MFTNPIKTTTHPSFLSEVIAQLPLYDGPGKRLLVFPTQLSIDYFKSLCHKDRGPDGCVTLHQLMRMHSKLALLPTWALLSRLYQLAEPAKKASFEEFCGWGFRLLEDFNRIDSHLVDGKAKGLWRKKEDLALLYQSFKEGLIGEGKGYEGLCYRMAQPLPEMMAQALVFIGFNLLTPVEERFITQCQAVASTTFFWDVDAHYLDNPVNIAGHYLRQHREKKWFQKDCLSYLNDPDKKVFLIEAATTVAQVQAVAAALQEKTIDGKPMFLPSQTAIVVSGSTLLVPLFDQLAKLAIPIYCRVDYLLHATVIYRLVERLVQLWEAFVAEEMYSHMADLLALWHPFAEETVELTVMRALLDEHKLPSLFDLWLHKESFLSYLQASLTYIYSHFVETKDLLLELNKTALHDILAYIEGLMAERADCSTAFFLNGLRQRSMGFHKGNALTGLSIIEVAESYNLDFENVFFLNMNEGAFPKPVPYDSLLPYDLCYSFGLPLADKTVAYKTAYGFYRLLQRAQNIYAYYVQKNHLETSGEMSRLLLQLTFDSKLTIVQSHHSIDVGARPIAPISIQKDDAVMQLVDRVAASGLTPAALIAYLSCPLQFYFRYLLQLKQTVKDDAVALGILFHDVMARLYQPCIGMQMDKRMVMALKSKVKLEIEQAMAASGIAFGMPLLLHALLEKLVDAMLEVDGRDAPFSLLGVEVAIKLALDAPRKVLLHGIIDRIDRKNHVIRIIDYKTGWSNSKIPAIATLFDPTKIQKNKAVFQLVFYAWLYHSLHGADNPQPIMPYLIHIREIFSKDYMPGIFIQASDNVKKYQRIEDIRIYLQPFEEGLKTLLLEIFNPAIPFAQTTDRAICAYCPYVRICQRE